MVNLTATSPNPALQFAPEGDRAVINICDNGKKMHQNTLSSANKLFCLTDIAAAFTESVYFVPENGIVQVCVNAASTFQTNITINVRSFSGGSAIGVCCQVVYLFSVCISVCLSLHTSVFVSLHVSFYVCLSVFLQICKFSVTKKFAVWLAQKSDANLRMCGISDSKSLCQPTFKPL